MPVRIRSLLVTGPVVIPLNTGRNVRLSPGESSAELHDVEVADNVKVDKLVSQGVIAVDETTEESAPAAPSRSRKRSGSAE
ncbi:hypothetical protein [Amycolatopsis sp. NPDC051128]|uniref:hypothetical protein n=1 Tax=Amycolatopsis sp. NPDC051128 TaxID=3155412 RepID=UPI00343F17FC